MNLKRSVNFEEYFSRQLRVPNFGSRAQVTLHQKKCLIVGMGGLGCPAAHYLAASGIGTLGLCDDDDVELSNVNRQILYTVKDIGKKKVRVSKRALLRSHPFLQVEPHIQRLNETLSLAIIKNYDIVLDCSDNFHTKFLVHDSCLFLGLPLVHGGVYQSHGQVLAFQFGNETQTACMRCVWNEEPDALCTRSCADAGVLTVLTGTIALAMCSTAIQCLLNPEKAQPVLRLYNYENQNWQSIQVPVRTSCVCQQKERNLRPEFLRLFQNEALEIETLPSEGNWQLLDVRPERYQHEQEAIRHYAPVALSDRELKDIEALDLWMQQFDKKKKYVLICAKGYSSIPLTRIFRSRGFMSAFSLAGGYHRLRKDAKKKL